MTRAMTHQGVSKSTGIGRGAPVHLAFGLLLCRSILLGQTVSETCIVSGHILNRPTGQPMRGASVQLTDAAQASGNLTSSSYVFFGNSPKSSNRDLRTESLNDGTFCFRAVQAGQYVLSASKTGFLDSSYGAKSYLQTGSVLAVGGTPLHDIPVTLDPMSGIVGQVIDNTGDTVADANVVAAKRVWYQGRQVLVTVQGTQSDERGRYRIGKLTPGTYFVSARPIPRTGARASAVDSSEHLVRTYYPSSLGLTNASAVSVLAGEDANGIDIRAIRTNTYHVRGRIEGPKDQWLGGAVQLLPREENQMSLVFGVGNVAADGSFDFPDVSPGLYRLAFQSPGGASELPVEVSDGDTFVIAPSVGNSALRGRILLEEVPNSGPSNMPKVALSPADAIVGPTYHADIDSNGGISVNRIRPGKYFLNITVPAGAFVKSIRSGSSELTSRELDLSHGGSLDLTIVVRHGSATLGGTVAKGTQSDTAVAFPANVILIASPPRIDGSGVYCVATDITGQFTIKDVPPGKYWIVALPLLDVRLFQNPDILDRLAKNGTKVELQEKETQSIDLPPVLSDIIEHLEQL